MEDTVCVSTVSVELVIVTELRVPVLLLVLELLHVELVTCVVLTVAVELVLLLKVPKSYEGRTNGPGAAGGALRRATAGHGAAQSGAAATGAGAGRRETLQR